MRIIRKFMMGISRIVKEKSSMGKIVVLEIESENSEKNNIYFYTIFKDKK